MKILVTGGSGFAGRHLLRELTRRGEGEVVATVLGDLPASAAEDPGLRGVKWVPLDITSDDSVAEVAEALRPREIYHLAGQASVGASLGNPLQTWEVNATGTLRLLRALTGKGGRGRRLLMVSSAEVYGEVERSRQPIAVASAVRPVTPYGVSKAAAELVAFQVGAMSGLEVIIARSFNHIGPGQDERFAMPSMARQLARIRRGEAEPVLRAGNLDVVRDFLDVRDVVRAYVTLMRSGGPGALYNVCSGTARTLASVVARLVELSGTGARLVTDPARVRPVDIPMLVGDPGPLSSLGWRPEIALDDTLRDLLVEAERTG